MARILRILAHMGIEAESGEGGEVSTGGSEPHGRTVLVLDSNDETRAVVERALRDAGMTVISARDGRTAAKLASEMPGAITLSGYQTERTELLRRAEAARVEAVEANRAKSEFLATMSHELRTPLNAVLGYSELLDMGVLGPITESQHEHLERLRSSSVHLLALVNDVLNLSKIDAGRLELISEPGSIHEATEAALALVRPQAVERNLTLVNDCADTLGQFYLGDPNRVRQILANLLTNSIKFTDPGGSVVVTCGVSAATPAGVDLEGDGPWAFVSVRDTGIGIGSASLEKMFDPFVQEEGGRTRQRGGTGLGLAISRSFARLMHGDVTVESELGRGSTFTLWLPSPIPSPLSAATSREAGADHTEAADPTLLARDGAPGTTVSPILSDAAAEEMSALGRILGERVGETTTNYVRALRMENVVPPGHQITDTHLRDHGPTFIMELATAVIELGALRERAGALLRDGSDLQRAIAELHGAQRYRLGWSESDTKRDTEIMTREVLASLDRIVPRQEARGDGYRYAVELLRTSTMRGAANSLRSYRAAAAADAR